MEASMNSRLVSHAAASTSGPQPAVLCSRPQRRHLTCSRRRQEGAQLASSSALSAGLHAHAARCVAGHAAAGNRVGQPPTLAVPAGMHHLDMAFMEEVYKETQMNLSPYNPGQRSSNKRILQRLGAATSLQQVSNIVTTELPAMAPHTLTYAMLLVCFGPSRHWLKEKSTTGSTSSEADVSGSSPDPAATAPAAAISTPPASRSTEGPSGWPQDPTADRHARSLVRTLLRRLAECAAGPNAGGVDVTHVGTALMAVRVVLAPLGTRTLAAREAQLGSLTAATGSTGGGERAPVNGHVSHTATTSAWGTVASSTGVPLPTMSGAPAPAGAANLVHGGLADAQDMSDLSMLLATTQSALFVARPQLLSQYASCIAGFAPLLHAALPPGSAPFGTWAADFGKVCQSKLMLMDGRQMSAVAWGLTRLCHTPSTLLVESMVDAVQPHLGTLAPIQLVYLLRSLAYWRANPNGAWFEDAQRAVGAALVSLHAPALSLLLASLTSLRAPMPSAWCSRVLARLAGCATDMSATAHSQVLEAMARVRAQTFVEERVMKRLVTAAVPRLASATAAELVSQLWSLSSIRFLPTRAWMTEWAACMRRQARGLSASGLAAVLVAHARFGVRPPRELLQDLMELQLAQVRAGSVSPGDACSTLNALSSLELVPPRQVVRALLAALLADPPTTDLRWPVASMRHATSPSGTAAPVRHDIETHEALQEAHAKSLVGALAALPPLLSQYDPTALASMAGTDASSGVSLPGAAGVSNSAEGAAGDGTDQAGKQGDDHAPAEVLAMLVPASQMSGLLDVVQSRLGVMTTGQLYVVVRTLALLQLNPGRAFLTEHLAQVSKRMGNMDSASKDRFGNIYRRLQACQPIASQPRAAVAGPGSAPGGGTSVRASRSRTPVPRSPTPGSRRAVGPAGY